ncbi:MAG TPA: hypothetical protein VJB99_02500 [Patescibacteria group bacterium]|nr:hypothetical protein [Patescibacteria group bacterium]
MKRQLFSVLGILSFVLMPMTSALAATQPTQEQIDAAKATAAEAKQNAVDAASAAGVTFDQYKVKLIELLDKAVSKLDTAEETLKNNAYLSQATKDELVKGLNTLEAKLVDYKNAADDATSLSDLENLNKQVIELLKQNRTVIQEAMRSGIMVIAGEMVESIQIIVDKAEAMLKTLEIQCDVVVRDDASKADKVDVTGEKIEDEIAQLEDYGTQLQANITAKDKEATKATMKAAAQVAAQLAKDIAYLQQLCAS